MISLNYAFRTKHFSTLFVNVHGFLFRVRVANYANLGLIVAFLLKNSHNLFVQPSISCFFFTIEAFDFFRGWISLFKACLATSLKAAL